MDFLASLTRQSAQLYSKLFPIPCFLCGTPSQHWAVCDQCIAAFPLLGSACQRCAMPLQTGSICGKCLSSPPQQDLSFSTLRYTDAVKLCVTAFKYQQQLQFSSLFAHLMSRSLNTRDNLPELLIPIPLHPIKIRQRGYNQAAELAKDLSQRLGIPHTTSLLSRVKNTLPQSSLPFKQRRHNLRHAFRCKTTVAPKHIAIIDDVMTSGFTSNEAAKTLRQQGAEIIEVWTIARAISHY